MQPPVEPVRDHLTEDQVWHLIRLAPSVIVGRGCEVTDLAQDDVEDLGADFMGGSVERQAYATLHGGGRLAIHRTLAWGWAVVRPYMTISDGQDTARFNLGAYFTSNPSRARTGGAYDVQVVDLLYPLNFPAGDAYSINAGDFVLERVEAILFERGYTKVIVDQSRADAVAPDARTWAMDKAINWLTIVNELLAMIGYQGVWSDWNGYLRCQAYSRPVERPYEMYLPADRWESINGLDAEVSFDFHDAPNRWVGVRSNNPEDVAPIEGAGVYTYENAASGPTSIEGRRGMVITRQESFDIATQADLVTAVQSMADADMSIPTTIATTTSPLPLAWHFDRYLVDDPEIGPPSEVVGTSWSLPLDGGAMAHTWTVLSGVIS
jgi:hypothetical protein